MKTPADLWCSVVAPQDGFHGRDRGRSAREFWQIPRSGWRDIAARVWSETSRDNIALLSAGVAFYGFLAFVPLLAAVVLLYGIFADPTQVARHIGELDRVLPADAAHIIGQQLKDMTQTPVTRTTIGLIVAILLAVYGAMRGATSVIAALNVTYGEIETRGIVRTTGLALAFTLGAIVTAITSTVAIGAMTVVGSWIRLPTAVGPALQALTWLVEATVASGLIALIYRYGPDREHARWTWLAPGSVFASVGALLGTLRGGSVCLHSLAGSLSGSPAVDHAAARSGWLKYIWSGVLQPRLE